MIELNPPLQSVSEITQERLGLVRDTADTYTPNESVLRELGHKMLIPIVGPCAVGKSYVIDTLVRQYPEFAKVLSFSTRGPRPDDTPDTMICLPWDERHIKRVCSTIEAGEAVNYIFHPKTDDIYGTTIESYPGTYNLLPALSGSVAALERLPFRAVRTVGLITAPESWDVWFASRQFASSSDRTARLAEAASSLEWLLSTPQAAIIGNVAGDPNQAARAIHDLATAVGNTTATRDEAMARALLDHITRLRS